MVLKTIGLLAVAVPLTLAAETPVENFDVVIVSGSSAGVGAAIGAGRLGQRVALIEDTPVLGGMLSNGICNIDSYSYAALSGVFEEFRQSVIRHYKTYMLSDPVLEAEQRKLVSDRKNRPASNVRPIDPRAFWSHDPWEGGVWEPQVADAIFKEMVARYPNIKVFYKRFASGIIRVNRRVVGVVTEEAAQPYAYAPAVPGSKKIFYGKVIVDATHEGDIAAWAGAPYRVGREPRSPEEPHAGEIYVQEQTDELVRGSNGRQDAAPSGYILRMTVECDFDPNDPSHILKSPPPGYSKENYEDSVKWAGTSWGSGAVTGAGTAAQVATPVRACPGGPKIPHSQAEWNGSEFRNGLDHRFWLWAEASRDERREMYDAFKNSALGYLYFLQHERGYTNLGLTRYAWKDNGNVPYRVFVREARRIMGDEILTEKNVNAFLDSDGLRPPLFADSIALVHHPIDAKPVEPKRDFSTPEMLGNGNMYLPSVATATQIPYGALLPQGVDGLLVAAAFSTTHMANSVARQDPMWVVTGQAAGIAAALSAREGVLPRDLPIQQLQQQLIQQKCKLVFYYDVSADRSEFPAIERMSLRGIVMGKDDRTFRPDEPLTRADAAVWLVKAFDIWPSVTASHFEDVSYKDPAFKAIETLCDNALLGPLGFEPLWRKRGQFDAKRDSGYQSLQDYGKFHPDAPVSAAEFSALIRGIERRGIQSPGKADIVNVPVNVPSAPGGSFTRAVAVEYLESVLRKAGEIY